MRSECRCGTDTIPVVYPDDGVRSSVSIDHTGSGTAADQAKRRPPRSPATSRLGYAYVATQRNVPAAVTGLNQLDVHSELIFIEQSLQPGSMRPQLQEALAIARPGDTLVVERLARLARSHHDLVSIVTDLHQRQLELEIAGRRISSLSPAEVLRLSAELEHDLAVAAVTAEARYWTERGQRGDHPRLSPISAARMRELFDSGMPRHELMRLFRVSKATVYRVCRPGRTEAD